MTLPKTTVGFLFHFVRQQRVKFLFLTLFSAIWATNDVFFPYFLKWIIDILQKFPANMSVFSAVKVPFILLIAAWVVTEILNRIQGLVQRATFPRFRANI